MKKIIAMFLVLVLCLCGCSAEEMFAKEELVLPEIPTQMPALNLPTMPDDSGNQGAEGTQETVSSEKTYPWEKKFNDAGYVMYKETFSGGTAYTWLRGNEKGRQLTYYNNGSIEDTYYYPSGFMSHGYHWHAEGFYTEFGHLDNGYIETAEDGSRITHLGTPVFSKLINEDGSWEEMRYNSEGFLELMIRQLSDGCYQESHYNSEGFCVHAILQGADGSYTETLRYDNGQLQYQKYQTSDQEQEDRYDEEGFMTYHHTRSTDYELELIADESGKLVKAIENGQTIEDPSALAQYVTGYNFRN